MAPNAYRTGQFARRAGVTLRTLRYYDRVGLLRPSAHTEAGHRLYSDGDLVTLEQILALKFLGFTLAEIKGYLGAGPERLEPALARQRAMLLERRAQIDAVLRAIEAAQEHARGNGLALEALVHIMEAVQMDQKNDWVKKYFTDEQRKTMEELSDKAYSEEAKAKMDQWPAWTEEDQRRVDAEYAALAEGLKRLVAEGADPASPEAQALAAKQADLLAQFTKGDPDIEAGLANWWQGFEALPADQQPPALPWGHEEAAFLEAAMAIYRSRKGA